MGSCAGVLSQHSQPFTTNVAQTSLKMNSKMINQVLFAVVAAVLLSADCGLHQLRLCLDPHRRQPALLQAAHTAGYLACLAVLLLPALAPHSGGAADAARGLVVLAAVATTAAGCGELYLSWAARSLEAAPVCAWLFR